MWTIQQRHVLKFYALENAAISKYQLGCRISCLILQRYQIFTDGTSERRFAHVGEDVQKENPVRAMYRSHKNLFVHMFHWNNSFDYYVFNKEGALIASSKS